MMANNVPLTIQTVLDGNLSSQVVIGSNTVSCKYGLRNVYWCLVIDRSDLSVKENFTFSTNNVVPAQLKPYIGNSNYVLILTTQYLTSANLPQGAFYDYLTQEGAGTQLNRAEQIYETLSCGTWGWFSYAYVAIMGDPTTNGFEFLDMYHNAMVSTLYFFPTDIGGKTIYTPSV
jgi:hypothetical protein